MTHKIEERDGMRIEWDAPIEMDDGLVLRADIFRPLGSGRHPVIMSYGPYGKGVSFQEAYAGPWQQMSAEFPDAVQGSSNLYANWETIDPEKWVRKGYACIRVDSRGAGRSPGFLVHNNYRENRDYYLCIEWAGEQDWCNGKVGLNGISYYAASQWRAAALKPPHLAAICVWEGWVDNYRDANRHGGILSVFRKTWHKAQVRSVQHGVGTAGRKSPATGELACGPETLSEQALVENREDMWRELSSHTLDGPYYRERSGDLPRVEVPLLSAGNWGGAGLHGRGNFEGFVQSKSQHKWLEVHGDSHWSPFYVDAGVELQMAFFDYFLKGIDNGWGKRPKVDLKVRRVDGFEQRFEQEWPIARTAWTKLHLSSADFSMQREPAEKAGTVTYQTMGDGVKFWTAPFDDETEITGPLALKISISSKTKDADLFIVLSLFDPQGKEVLFFGAVDPKMPVAQGWLRASHRNLDEERSLPYRPYHTHDRTEFLEPGQIVDLDIEIWPTCIVVPKGYRLALSVRGRDYEHGIPREGKRLVDAYEMKGCGPFMHDDEEDRPSGIFDTQVTIHIDQEHPSYLLVPVIPAK